MAMMAESGTRDRAQRTTAGVTTTGTEGGSAAERGTDGADQVHVIATDGVGPGPGPGSILGGIGREAIRRVAAGRHAPAAAAVAETGKVDGGEKVQHQLSLVQQQRCNGLLVSAAMLACCGAVWCAALQYTKKKKSQTYCAVVLLCSAARLLPPRVRAQQYH